jgi:tetratricopeptide (TPR) repeat protein
MMARVPSRIGLESAQRGVALALSLLPPVALALLVRAHWVDVPYWDQWQLVPLLDAWYRGELSPGDLFAQHNEHRNPIARVLLLALALWSDWNVGWELATSFVLALGTFAALLAILRQTRRVPSSGPLVWAAPLSSLLLFSFAQWENWLWGWQLTLVLNLCAAVVGIALLGGRPLGRWRLTAALLCGLVATYSFGNGFLWWLAALVPLLASSGPATGARLRAAALWLAVAATSVLVYAIDFRRPLHHPSWASAWEDPLAYARYVLAFLGNPVHHDHAIACGGLGLLLLLTAGVALAWRPYRRSSRELAPYLALACYALLSALLIGVGRSGFGPEQARSSRYVSFGNLLWIADLALLLLLVGASGAAWRRSRRAGHALVRALAGVALVAVSASAAHTSLADRAVFAAWRERLGPARVALAHVAEAPAGWPILRVERQGRPAFTSLDRMLARLLPDPEDLRIRARVLRRHRLSVFRAAQPREAAVREAEGVVALDAEPLVASLREGLRADPRDRRALRDLAIVLTYAGRHAEAAGSYEALVREQPGDPALRLRWGESLMRAGRPERAVPVLEELVSGSSSPRAQLELGRALLGADEPERAARQLTRALEQAPGDAEARRLLGEARLREGDAQAARSELERALLADPADPRVHLALGEIARASGEPERARAHLREALRLRPYLLEAHQRMGELLGELGDQRAAARHLARARELAGGGSGGLSPDSRQGGGPRPAASP